MRFAIALTCLACTVFLTVKVYSRYNQSNREQIAKEYVDVVIEKFKTEYKPTSDSLVVNLAMTYYRAGWYSGSNAAGSLERAGSLDSAGLAEAWELDSLNLINLINDEMEKNAETPR